jgi:hypothetical protein
METAAAYARGALLSASGFFDLGARAPGAGGSAPAADPADAAPTGVPATTSRSRRAAKRQRAARAAAAAARAAQEHIENVMSAGSTAYKGDDDDNDGDAGNHDAGHAHAAGDDDASRNAGATDAATPRRATSLAVSLHADDGLAASVLASADADDRADAVPVARGGSAVPPSPTGSAPTISFEAWAASLATDGALGSPDPPAPSSAHPVPAPDPERATHGPAVESLTLAQHADRVGALEAHLMGAALAPAEAHLASLRSARPGGASAVVFADGTDALDLLARYFGPEARLWGIAHGPVVDRSGRCLVLRTRTPHEVLSAAPGRPGSSIPWQGIDTVIDVARARSDESRATTLSLLAPTLAAHGGLYVAAGGSCTVAAALGLVRSRAVRVVHFYDSLVVVE